MKVINHDFAPRGFVDYMENDMSNVSHIVEEMKVSLLGTTLHQQ
jgi:hypothetical protein